MNLTTFVGVCVATLSAIVMTLILTSQPSVTSQCKNGVVFTKHIHNNFWVETSQKCVVS
jgi:hypothetical protein